MNDPTMTTTTKPSDAAVAQAFREHFGGVEADGNCTCAGCNIMKRARTIDAERAIQPAEGVTDCLDDAEPESVADDCPHSALDGCDCYAATPEEPT